MKELYRLIDLYWRRHKKSAAALMFAGMLLTAVVTAALLLVRSEYRRKLHRQYDQAGYADVTVPPLPQQQALLHAWHEQYPGIIEGSIFVPGKAGIGNAVFSYGFLDDPEGLAHIPMESGRLPVTADEIAADRSVLNRWNWNGKPGDTLTLDTGTYRVCGIIDEVFGRQRLYSEIGAESPAFSIPLIYVGKPETDSDTPRFVMLDAAPLSQEQQTAFRNQIDSVIASVLDEKSMGKYARWFDRADRAAVAANIGKKPEFQKDVRWMLMLSGLAAVIAVLSVIAVQRIVRTQRQPHLTLLHRIGLSNAKLGLMELTEYAVFCVIQTALGILSGIGVYALIYLYQTKALDMAPYSGITTDRLVTAHTKNPYLTAALFSAAVMLAACLLNRFFGHHAPDRRRPHRIRSTRGMLRAVFAQRSVTVMQSAALMLICLGTLLGYAYFTDTGKSFKNGLLYEFPEDYALGNGFTLNAETLPEYYSAPQPSVIGITAIEQSETLPLADGNDQSGIGDDTASRLPDAVCIGSVSQTLIVTDEPNVRYQNQVQFSHEDEIAFLLEHSDAAYRNFFADGGLGSKQLYRTETKLASENLIRQLAPYIAEGDISYDRLRNGSKILVIEDKRNRPLFHAGDTVKLASVCANEQYGIGDIQLADAVIGAVLSVPEDAGTLLQYAVSGSGNYRFLTLAKGASNLGLHHAAYCEIFAQKPLDGGLIPGSAGMTLHSYAQIRQRLLKKKLLEHGGMVLIAVLMSLLGFAAYFNGIGMKIRMKSYQISILRAVGASRKKLRRRLTIDSMKIPLLSGAAALLLTKAVQQITAEKYSLFASLFEQSMQEETARNPQLAASVEQQCAALRDRYFLDRQLWEVPVAFPAVWIVLGICLVSVMLTVTAFRAYDRSIVQHLNEGRKKQ